MKLPLMTEIFIIEANVTTLAQMNKLPLSVAQKINDFDRQNAPTLAMMFANRYREFLNNSMTKEEQKISQVEEWLKTGIGGKVSQVLKKKPAKKQEIEKSFKNDYRNFLQVLKAIQSSSTVEDMKKRSEISFPDGYFWIHISGDECSQEASDMQHCGRADGKMYSLRDTNGKSHVTIDLDKSKTAVLQVRGKQNKTPDEKYWPYIKAFVNHFNNAKIKDNSVSHDLKSFVDPSFVTPKKIEKSEIIKNLSDDWIKYYEEALQRKDFTIDDIIRLHNELGNFMSPPEELRGHISDALWDG